MLDRIGTQADRVYLREPRDLRDRYLAVSHCWGLSPRLVTKRTNLLAHKSGILVTELAATFQDAIHVARALGIRFVWIDSLCIVQGDFADWEREAARMGDVYSNAYLTVSALSSQDDSDGIFTPFEERIPRPQVSSDTRSTGRRCFANATPVVEEEAGYDLDEHMYHFKHTFAKCEYLCGTETCLVFVTSEWMPSSFKPKCRERTMEGNTSRTRGYNENTQMYLIGQFGGSFDPFEDEPLVTRGWTLQERLLSRRTVHFGADEMFWECQQCVLAEDGAVLERTFPKRKGVLLSRVPQLSTHAAGNQKAESPVTRKWPDPWLELVEDYSTRTLTRPEDKLPALSGLARQLAASSGDSYFAGIWLRDILQCLNWEVYTQEAFHNCDDHEHDAAPPTKSTVSYPPKYRAPSWSWASIDARVSFKALTEKVCAEYLHGAVHPLANDPFGQVAGGYIAVKVR